MRNSLVRRGAAAVLAVFVGLATVTLAASPARADVSVVGVTFSPSTLVQDGDADCDYWVKQTVKLYDRQGDDDDVVLVGANIYGPRGNGIAFVQAFESSRNGDYVYYTGNFFLCGGLHEPGRYTVRTELMWWDENVASHETERVDSFTIKRPTSLTYNATPEPVKKNSTLTHKGVLKADAVIFGPKKGLKGAVLTFYFKADGAKTYTYKGKVTTGAGGQYSKKFKATKSGMWKVVYAGSSTRQPQTRFDAVKVK
jgi:hypothetical protein